MSDSDAAHEVGWVGTGRMGYALVERLLAAGHRVAVHNRTRSRAEPLAALGAEIVDSIMDLSDREVVFTMVGGSDDLQAVITGPGGLLSGPTVPRVIVDSTTVSPSAGADVRAVVQARSCDLLAAPVSGNPAVVRAGQATVVVSGPREGWQRAEPYLGAFGRRVAYVGDGERARLVKVCHNLMLGVLAQCTAEVIVLAEKGGISRSDFLEFINDSGLGSGFTRYKSPAFIDLDFTPTFTNRLLLKDFHAGLEAARELEVPMTLAAVAQETVARMVGLGYGELDFASLLELQARSAGYELKSEQSRGGTAADDAG